MRTIALFVLLGSLLTAQKRVTDAEVDRVHRSALLIDLHNDVTSFTVDGMDIGKPNPSKHTDIDRLRRGGVGAQFFAVYVSGETVKTKTAAHRTLEMIDTVRHDIIERYPKEFTLALTAADIEAARKSGKIAALMGIEGGHAIEDSLRVLRDFYDLGIRYMTLTHSNTNNWADSSGDFTKAGVKHHNGLTELGKQVVREMNRLGMMIDISHVADKTFWDALSASQAPLIASHSSCRAVTNVPRNMTDEMIAALAKKGGVVHINFNCGFLSQATATGETALEKKLGKYEEAAFKAAYASGQIPKATMKDVIAHIDRAVKVGGIDAVGLGSDFDGVPCTPVGLDDVSKFRDLTRALLEKGYSAADIRKLYGLNTLRVMRKVEEVAATLRH
jgi:membrane dipeptidase